MLAEKRGYVFEALQLLLNKCDSDIDDDLYIKGSECDIIYWRLKSPRRKKEWGKRKEKEKLKIAR